MRFRTITLTIIALAVVAAGLYVAMPNRAGAAPTPGEAGEAIRAVPEVESANADRREHDAWVEESILTLDQAKKNEDGLRFVVDQEDAKTDASGKVRLCLNTVPIDVDDSDGLTDTYAEPTDVNPADGLGDCPDEGAAAPYDPRVTSVMVDLATNLDNPGNSPTESQTRFNVADGAVLVFLKNGEPVVNSTVRFTYVAVGAG